MIETRYRLIKDALLKMTDDTKKGWVKFLLLVLFIDRTTAKRITKITLYKMLMGEDIILSIKTEVPT